MSKFALGMSSINKKHLDEMLKQTQSTQEGQTPTKEEVDTALDKVTEGSSNTTTETPTNPLYNYGYTDTYKKLADDYGNKASQDFSYNVYGSNLYNQYKNQYTKQAQYAAEDAAGRAAALTGGYGNSYVVPAAANAYNARMDDLNGVALQLYQLALDKYDKDRTYNLNMMDYYNKLDKDEKSAAQALWEADQPKYALTDYGKLPQGVRDNLGKATTNEKLQDMIDGYITGGYFSPEVGAAIYNELFDPYENLESYGGMLNNLSRWGAGYSGDTNWFGGIDENAEVITPTGHKITAKALVDEIVREGTMSKEAATEAVIKLLEHLGIND